MGGNHFGCIDHGGWRDSLTQLQLLRVRFGGEAFALLAEDLAPKPLNLVFEGGDLLVLHRDGLRLHARQGGKLRGAHRGDLR